MKYILDTHTWIWWNMQPKNLSQRVLKIITEIDNYDEMLLSAISIWEFSKLIEKDNLAISCDTWEWIDKALDMPKLRLVHLLPKISYHSTILPKPFRNDPADQIIVASSRYENATILTKDSKILKYKYVSSIW